MAIARPADLLSTAGPSPLQVATLTVATTVVFAMAAALPVGGAPSGPGAPPAAATDTPRPADEPTASPRPTLDPTPSSATPRVTPSPSPTVAPTVAPATPAPVATLAPTPRPAVPAPTPAPQPVPPPPAGGGLPACTYADVLTPHHGLGEWQISLLDTIYQLPSTYAPGDLVDTGAAGLNGGYAIRAFMAADLAAMAADARAAGSPIQVVSGYRSYTQQQATFDHWVSVGGYEQALRTSARPGHSEHQLGTAIDVTSEGGAAPWEYADWATTPAGAWMAANAWRYGFVMSYPPGASALTCYSYEPWHYRYVGRDLAAQVAARGAVLRQVIWELQ
jgi:zinc D-Ala-D-Ala carboxypeptidase